MIRAKPLNYDLITKAILANCTEAKSMKELAELLKVHKNVVYRASQQLIAAKCLIPTNDLKVTKFLTVSFDFQIIRKTKYVHEHHVPSLGGRVISFETKDDEHGYRERYIQTEVKRREQMKSSKTHVGISTVYNG